MTNPLGRIWKFQVSKGSLKGEKRGDRYLGWKADKLLQSIRDKIVALKDTDFLRHKQNVFLRLSNLNFQLDVLARELRKETKTG